MKNFLLFAFDPYYPNGGSSDLKGRFNNYIAAVNQAIAYGDDYSIYQIYALETDTYKTFEIVEGMVRERPEMEWC